MLNIASKTEYLVTLNIQDIMWGIFILSLTVMVVFIIRLIRKAIQNLSETHKLIKMNQDYINNIIKNASSISNTADQVSKDIGHASKVFKPSIDNIAEASESMTKTFKDNNPINEGILKTYKLINNLNKAVTKKKAKEECEKKNEQKF